MSTSLSLPTRYGLLAQALNVFPFQCSAILRPPVQCFTRVWARFFGSSMKTDSDTPPPTASRPSRSPTAGKPIRPSKPPAIVLRVPRQPHGPQRRGPDEDLQPLPRPVRRTTQRSRSSASSTPPWTAPSSTPTAGPTSPPTASSSSTTRSTRKRGATGRSRTATAGPTTIRDEVLARLLELNAERAAEETRASHGQRLS